MICKRIAFCLQNRFRARTSTAMDLDVACSLEVYCQSCGLYCCCVLPETYLFSSIASYQPSSAVSAKITVRILYNSQTYIMSVCRVHTLKNLFYNMTYSINIFHLITELRMKKHCLIFNGLHLREKEFILLYNFNQLVVIILNNL